MENVTGIGGLFFRARDPVALALWYQEHLGVKVVPSNYDELGWQQEAGPTAFAPFPDDTKYFGDSTRVGMVNFRVRDLGAMAAQLRAAGITVEIDRTRTVALPAFTTPRAIRLSCGSRSDGTLRVRKRALYQLCYG
jgi:glyoxylase I family protein